MSTSADARESTRMIDLLAWVETNKKWLLIALVALAAAAAALSISRWRRNEAELSANQALLAFQNVTERNQTNPPPNPEALLKIANEYSGTSASTRALLLSAEALFEAGKFPEAQTRFEQFLRDFPGSSLAASAAYGVAAALDAQNKTNEATTGYQNVISRYGTSGVATQAKLGLARLNEAKNENQEALKIYDELIKPEAFSGWSSQASLMREQLLKRHPEVAAASTFVPPISVSTNAAGQRITITPVTDTNKASGTATSNAPAVKVTPQ